jgi:hypothetical protein
LNDRLFSEALPVARRSVNARCRVSRRPFHTPNWLTPKADGERFQVVEIRCGAGGRQRRRAGVSAPARLSGEIAAYLSSQNVSKRTQS